jgi:hypothetical protein
MLPSLQGHDRVLSLNAVSSRKEEHGAVTSHDLCQPELRHANLFCMTNGAKTPDESGVGILPVPIC